MNFSSSFTSSSINCVRFTPTHLDRIAMKLDSSYIGFFLNEKNMTKMIFFKIDSCTEQMVKWDYSL